MKSVSMIYEFRGLSHMGVSSLRILTVLSNLVLLGEYTGSVGNVQIWVFKFPMDGWKSNILCSTAPMVAPRPKGGYYVTAGKKYRIEKFGKPCIH
jgi:hypothetical protein